MSNVEMQYIYHFLVSTVLITQMLNCATFYLSSCDRMHLFQCQEIKVRGHQASWPG